VHDGIACRSDGECSRLAPTSACPKPGETITLNVVKGAQNYRVPSNEVTIERAGDGLPVAIKARVR
jgi:hypothetical protein